MYANRSVAAQSALLPQFVALALAAPEAAASNAGTEARDPIRVQCNRGALSVSVSWPVSASSQCAAWMRELLR